MREAGSASRSLPPGPDLTAEAGLDDGPRLPVFGPYQLQEIIGRGGMGEVYRAFDTARGRVVALKRLPLALAADPTFQARFRAEAALAARLHEPHVIPIHDFGEIDGQLYIDMRLVDGPDLAHLLRENGPLPAQRVVEIVTQVAAALDAAHAAGLVHRDIKPGNVLLVQSDGDVPTDFVYIADFGIARAVDGSMSGSLTTIGATVGSMDYIAPERFTGDHGDHRADIYALGCVLYEALTAQRPFPVEGLPAIINAHLNTPPPAPTARRPDLPTGLDAVVARAMAKDPDHRYPSARALAADARHALDGATVAALGTTTNPSVNTGSPPPAAPPLHGAAPNVFDTSPTPAAHPMADTGPTRVVRAPTPTPAAPRPRGRKRTILAAVVTVLVLAGAVVATQLITPSDSAVAVTEPGASDGVNPFMPSVTTQPPTAVPPGAGGTSVGGTVNGGASGLYGGTLNVASCDPAKMIAFLASNPDKAAAWAAIEGISPADIPGYVAGLTPVLLRADTAVTNHGFADGAATTLHSVLQAGTAVLVDRYGVPRARCACGNPLTPSTLTNPTNYTGDRWAAFDPAHVVTLAPASAPMTQLTLVDPISLAAFTRPVGGNGTTDQAATPATPTTAPQQSIAPQPAPGPQLSNAGDLPQPATLVRVPNVVGQDTATATATLENQGLRVGTNAVDGGGASGTVQSTNPAPGTRVRPGSTITLNVLQTKKEKKKDDGVQVPGVVGQTLANAAQTLASAGYTNLAVQGSRDPNAIVVDQQPSGGSSADAATRVTLTTQLSGTSNNGFGLLN